MAWQLVVGAIMLALGLVKLIELASNNPLLAALLIVVIGLLFILGPDFSAWRIGR